MKEQQVKDRISEVMDGLNPRQQRRVAKKLVSKYSKDKKSIEKDLAEKREELNNLQLYREEIEGVISWDSENAEFALQKNSSSRLHKLNDAAANGRLLLEQGKEDIAQEYIATEHTMVVCHDWYKLIGNVDDNEVRFPYEYFAFEFVVNNRCVIALCFDKEAMAPDESYENPRQFTAFVHAGRHWLPLEHGGKYRHNLTDYLWCQIKAICVSLDAEVAESEVIRAPYKLNKKREQSGKLPLRDYHIVNLAKRHRTSTAANGEGTKKRLHFRRGHWRHYDGFKTWVRWCLVGDPELGFVDKHYRM